MVNGLKNEKVCGCLSTVDSIHKRERVNLNLEMNVCSSELWSLSSFSMTLDALLNLGYYKEMKIKTTMKYHFNTSQNGHHQMVDK